MGGTRLLERHVTGLGNVANDSVIYGCSSGGTCDTTCLCDLARIINRNYPDNDARNSYISYISRGIEASDSMPLVPNAIDVGTYQRCYELLSIVRT